ncbi:hypothetical protein D5086_025217, partial [Populus alba]
LSKSNSLGDEDAGNGAVRPTDSGMSRSKQKNSFSKGCILESPKQKPNSSTQI